MARTKKLLKDHAPELYAQIPIALNNNPNWFPNLHIPTVACYDETPVWWQCSDCER